MTPETSEAREAVVDLRVRARAVMREVNEQIHKLDTPVGVTPVAFCECSDGDCLRQLAIPSDAYEAVRGFPGRFVVAPGHVCLSHERVVEDHGDYVVVEMTRGR